MPAVLRLFPALLVLAAACASRGPLVTSTSAGDVETLGNQPTAPVVVRVRNAFSGPLALYTLHEGVATRLGEIAGQRTADFALAATQLPAGGLTLLGVPNTGDARATSGPVRLHPGDTVDFNIGASLGDARAAVRSP